MVIVFYCLDRVRFKAILNNALLDRGQMTLHSFLCWYCIRAEYLPVLYSCLTQTQIGKPLMKVEH